MILSTPTVIGEQADDTNPDDERLDEYSDISRKVAKESGSLLLDLHKGFLGHTSFKLGGQVSSFPFTHWPYFGAFATSKTSAKSTLLWFRSPGPLHSIVVANQGSPLFFRRPPVRSQALSTVFTPKAIS